MLLILQANAIASAGVAAASTGAWSRGSRGGVEEGAGLGRIRSAPRVLLSHLQLIKADAKFTSSVVYTAGELAHEIPHHQQG